MIHLLEIFLVTILFATNAKASTYDFVLTGRLTESTGKPVDGPVALSVKFYHVATGGSPILTVTSGLESVALTEGIFHVRMILDAADYNAVFPNVSQSTYFEITDLSNAPTSPYERSQVTMLPYAAKVPIDSKVFTYDNNGKMTLYATPENGKFLKGNADGTVSWDVPSGGSTPATSETYTNKTIDADNNTITNIADANIKASAAISDSKLATISSAGKVSGSAITAGTITGSTAVNTSGSIATTGKAGVGVAAGTSQLEVKGGGATSATSSLNVTDSAGSSKLFVRDDGNVGIGTSSPTARLHVVSSNSSNLVVHDDGSVMIGSYSSSINNLAPNPDFGSAITGWTLTDLSGGSSQSWQSTASGDGSLGFLRFNIAANNNWDRFGVNTGIVAAGITYNVSFWYRTAGLTGGLNFVSTSNFSLMSNLTTRAIPISSSWTYTSFSFTTLAGSAPFVGFSKPGNIGSGTFDVDRISITEAGSAGLPTLTLSSSGRVGVGNSTGANRLDVNGSIALGAYSGTAAPANGLLVSGNVGIGTTAPQHPLQVYGVLKVGGGVSQTTGTIALGDDLTSSTNVGIYRGTLAGAISGGNVLNLAGYDGINLRVGNNPFASQNTALTAVTNGNIGINNTNPSQKLTIGSSGDGSVAIANSWTTYSDKRLKRGASIIGSALDKISKLSGYFFYWKKASDETRQIGVMAQEVEEVFPELIKTGIDGIKSVDYPKLVAPIIEAIKELRNFALQSFDLHSSEISELRRVNESLRFEYRMIRSYICEKDPQAVFCNTNGE